LSSTNNLKQDGRTITIRIKGIVRKTREFLAVAIFDPPSPIFGQQGNKRLFPMSLICSVPDQGSRRQIERGRQAVAASRPVSEVDRFCYNATLMHEQQSIVNKEKSWKQNGSEPQRWR
jgi:hypothetical protein